MSLYLYILAEFIRVYLAGLFYMLLITVFTTVSWSAVIAGSSFASVAALPIFLGLVGGAIVDTTSFVLRRLSWI